MWIWLGGARAAPLPTSMAMASASKTALDIIKTDIETNCIGVLRLNVSL